VAHIIARRMAGISLSLAVLSGAPGCEDRSPSLPLPVLTEEPARPPTGISYNLSGIVTDDAGSAVANAQLTLFYADSFATVTASTDARGHYSIAFGTAYTSFERNPRTVGAISYTGGGEYESYVQAVPWGTADVVKDLHLRRVRTVNAGESLVISIDPDSSVAYDGEDWQRTDWVWEKFHVRVADAGTLTVAPRPTSGGAVPVIAVFCVHVADNCQGMGVANQPPGTAARRFDANSLYEIRLAVPAAMAPQRYEVITSLQ
jgi:hypothetical protein